MGEHGEKSETSLSQTNTESLKKEGVGAENTRRV